MKKLSLLFLTVMLGMGAFAQTTYSWRSQATNGNWNVANNWWNGSTTALPNGGEILSFGNDVQTTMTNDLLTATNRYQIIFTNSATQSRIISGTTENTFIKNGTNKPKIENNSSANQTIDFPLKWEYIASSAMELKPVSGDLTITKAIDNNGLWTDVLGGSGKTLSIASMSGTGGLSIKNNPTTVKITGTSTYTGITHVQSGTLELQADLSSADIIVYSGAKLVINGNDVDVEKLTINSGGTVEVLPGKSLTVNGVLTNNGILTLKSDATGTATIITPATMSGTGTYNVEQYLSAARNWYISSPVTNAKAPTNYTYYKYDETGGNTGYSAPETAYWTDFASGTSLTPGLGFIALPTSASTITFTTQANGKLNSGEVQITLTRSGALKTGFNLIGNPFPCHLGWTYAFVNANSSLIESSIWIRTNGGTTNNSGQWSFATFNASSSEAVPSVANAGIIPPMQAFWVRAKTGGTLTLNSNLTKTHQTSNPLKAPAINTNLRKKLRLQVTNGTSTDELLIYSDENALNTYDDFDSPKMLNGSASAVPDIYTTAGTENLVINGLNTLPLDVVIPVSFAANSTTATSFTVSASELSNLPSGVKVMIADNSVLSSLSDGGTYTFNADAGTTKTFGLILRSPGAITGIENGNADKFHVYANSNRQIVVNAPATTLVNVYNSIGQRITSQNMNGTSLQIDVPAAGVYLVNVGGNVYKVVAP